MKIIRIFIGMLILAILWQCKTQQNVPRAEKVKLMGAKKLYTNVTERYLDFKTLSIKYSGKFSDLDNSHSFSGTLRIKKDSLIWISISPGLGIELARIQFTRDSIMFMNLMKDEFFVSDYGYFENKFMVDFSFDDLQSVLTNEIFLYSETEEDKRIRRRKTEDEESLEYFRKTFNTDNDSTVYVLKTHRKRKIKKYLKKRKGEDFIVETIAISPDSFKIKTVKVEDLVENRFLTIRYDECVPVDSTFLPSVIEIFVKSEHKEINARLKYNKFTVNKDISFPFNISEKYTRIKP